MRRTVQAAIVAAIFFAAAAAPAQDEERPKIFLEKKIFAETQAGKKSFYEVHTVEEGENLWKILSGRFSLSRHEFASMVKEFKRVNPEVADPARLRPGQKILVPSASRAARQESTAVPGKTEAYKVAKGDTLTKILAGRGVFRKEMPRYLDAVKRLNEEIRDVNRILAGATILLPSEGYFAAEAEKPEVALTKDVPREGTPDSSPAAKPEAQLALPASPPAPAAPATETTPKTAPGKIEEPPLRPKPPFRGLLTDILAGLGEKWTDRGTLYLPIPSGGEVVLNLEEFPIARFSTGVSVLVDFRGALTSAVRDLITGTWKNYQVVSMEGRSDAGEVIDRVLRSAGYHSVKEGLSRPLVIGEGISVVLPARWVVLRTPQSLLSGEVILIKEVPEKPSADLSAILQYAGEVGIRTLPYAVDPSSFEGFVLGMEEKKPVESSSRRALPQGGLEALDFALDFLGIPKTGGERLSIGGKGGQFQLVVQPERMFTVGEKRFLVDTGKMSPALRAIVRDAGYTVFQLGKEETGKEIFLRLAKTAEIPMEERKDFLLAGGGKEGFEVRVTGTFLLSSGWLEARKLKAAVLVRGKVHGTTAEMLRSLGVEIVGW